MKKSQGITLTVLAAIGMASHAQQAPPPAPSASPAPPIWNTCEERVRAAKKAGLPVTETCTNPKTSAHGAVRGGFGTTGKTNSSGG